MHMTTYTQAYDTHAYILLYTFQIWCAATSSKTKRTDKNIGKSTHSNTKQWDRQRKVCVCVFLYA